jgi:hypothetical protein
MRDILFLAIGLAVGFSGYFAYDFDRAVDQQIQIAAVQAKVDAALSLCPAAFVNVVKQEEKKVK